MLDTLTTRVIAKLTSSSTWRWNEIECQSVWTLLELLDHEESNQELGQQPYLEAKNEIYAKMVVLLSHIVYIVMRWGF